MSYVPEKGDIVLLDFNPSAGSEITKRRPAIVVSRQAFNQHTKFAIVAPITSTKRGIALEENLDENMTTKGVILIHQLRSLDIESRGIQFIEKASQHIIDNVTKKAVLIIQ